LVAGVVAVIVIAIIILLELRWGLIPMIDVRDLGGDLSKILIAIIVVCVAWISLLCAKILFERYSIKKVGSHAQVRSLWKLISYSFWIFILIVLILGLIGDFSSLVIYIGLIGAALTFVLQQPLLNILSWGIISYKGIYRIGDRVALGGSNGYVLDIGLMHTDLWEFGQWMKGDTFTGRVVSVPNSVIYTEHVSNYTRDFPFIWDEIVNLVTYESNIDVAKEHMANSAKEVIGDCMRENYDRYSSRLRIKDLEQLLLKEPEIRMDFSESGVNIYVLYFCPAEQRRMVKAEITERIWRRFMEDPRVEIAYPHMHLVGDLPQNRSEDPSHPGG
jgi:small-conductance mechanosensitive channel